MSSRTSSIGSPSRSRHVQLGSTSQVLRPAPLSTTINHADPLVHINRASKNLQATIQTFLDAQSEGLIAGLGSEQPPSSSASIRTTSTPDIYASQYDVKLGTVPPRQPSKQKVTLRSARRGLLKCMKDFTILKEEENNILDVEVQKRKDALHTLDAFASKKSGLEQEISKIQSQDESQRATELKNSAQAVENEIHELETKLLELRAKHRYLVAEAKHLENSVSAKLSSYQASLQMVEKDVERYLRRPPISEPLNLDSSKQDGDLTPGNAFYTLNPKRRTLPIAEETWSEEVRILSEKQTTVSKEHTALLEGSEIWSSVIKEVDDFEKEMKRQMLQQASPVEQPLSDAEASHDPQSEAMISLIQKMDQTIASLESKMQKAQESNWNLLICCIGAELEAFQQGRDILTEAFGLALPPPSEPEDSHHAHLETDDTPDPSSAPDNLLDDNDFDADREDDSVARGTSSPRGRGNLASLPFRSGGSLRSSRLYRDADADDGGIGGSRKRASLPSSSLHQFHHAAAESDDDEPGPDFLVSHESIG